MIQLAIAMLVFDQGAVSLCHLAIALAIAAINLSASQNQTHPHPHTPPAASHIDSAAIKAHMINFFCSVPRRQIIRAAKQAAFVSAFSMSRESEATHGVFFLRKSTLRNHSRGTLRTGSTLVWTSSIDPQWTPSGSSYLVTLQGIIAYAGYRMWTAISQIVV